MAGCNISCTFTWSYWL